MTSSAERYVTEENVRSRFFGVSLRVDWMTGVTSGQLCAPNLNSVLSVLMATWLLLIHLFDCAIGSRRVCYRELVLYTMVSGK